jgi:hypothetical protein
MVVPTPFKEEVSYYLKIIEIPTPKPYTCFLCQVASDGM